MIDLRLHCNYKGIPVKVFCSVFCLILLLGLNSYISINKKNIEFTSNNSLKTDEKKDCKKLFIKLVKKEKEKRVDVIIGGKLFTSYKWDANVFKPVLHPINTAKGTAITRGYPLDPKPGERADHLHHVGNWMNYGNVNDVDFWGNGSNGQINENGGEIVQTGIEYLKSGKGEALLITNCKWVDSKLNEILIEKTEYHFIANDSSRIIDRITKLTPTQKDVVFKDTKEGFFAIRVARELEIPSIGRISLINKKGVPQTYVKLFNKNITGNYRSSEGITGTDVWGTRARWVKLFGKINNEKVSIVICDHPENPNYPTYWHARAYGLFAANPFGVEDFTHNNDELNFSFKKGQTVDIKYRLIISSKMDFSKNEINNIANNFSNKYNH